MNALEAASLVMIPSGYQDGTLGSLKPLDGTGDFTFTRGSNISATRVNADGTLTLAAYLADPNEGVVITDTVSKIVETSEYVYTLSLIHI